MKTLRYVLSVPFLILMGIAGVISMAGVILRWLMDRGQDLIETHVVKPIATFALRSFRRTIGKRAYYPIDTVKANIQPRTAAERLEIKTYAMANGMHYAEMTDGTVNVVPGCTCCQLNNPSVKMVQMEFGPDGQIREVPGAVEEGDPRDVIALPLRAPAPTGEVKLGGDEPPRAA